MIVGDLTLMLEERAIGAGTVTRSGLQELLSSELERFLGSRGAEVRVPPDGQSAERIQSQLFQWGGGLRRLPQDFSLPAGNVVAAFRSWMLPDTSNNICALKNCTSSDFYCNNKKKRFSDYSVLMRLIQGGYSGLNPSLTEVNQILTAWEESGAIPVFTPKGRKRRPGQLKWTSVLAMIRLNSNSSE